MSIKVVLFDLDGTLLPMNQHVFTKKYFGLIAEKLVLYGYESEALINAIWAGTVAMVKNDGANTNEAVFWNTFSDIFGEKAKAKTANAHRTIGRPDSAVLLGNMMKPRVSGISTCSAKSNPT